MNTILVIEDQAQLRENLQLMLMLAGHTVYCAANGIEGLALARQHRPDVIICDILMPGMGGHEVLGSLREDSSLRGTPFIFLTARSSQADIRAGMNLGADDYLPKPFTRADLLAAVHSRLKRSYEQKPNFDRLFEDAEPLESLGISAREAEVLLWLAQGKSNADIAVILQVTTATVKRHALNLFAKMGVENRSSAALRAMEVLSKA